MPFSVTRDSETYWRSRYGLPEGANNGSHGPEPRKSGKARKRIHFRKPVFSGSRKSRARIWLAAGSAAGAGIAYFFLLPLIQMPSEKGTARVEPVALNSISKQPSDIRLSSFETLLTDFEEEREASLVALRGYLLTGGEGFQREWLQATIRMQAAAGALVGQSSNWTDGRKLVQLVEMQRLVGRLLAEERAVASIVNTVNRYPGLQLYTEDVQPALVEAQALCAEVMNAMLAISSPDVVGPIGPFAEFRGDLEDLRAALSGYMGASGDMSPPVEASKERLGAMGETLGQVRPQVPAGMQEKIDRLSTLLAMVEEKLTRIFALRESERWDYASYAFRTRVEPLAAKLGSIGEEWRASAGERS
jgi:hypothetical protein